MYPNPTRQVQSVTAELELGDELLAGQVRQVDTAVAAIVGEYVFAVQLMHALAPVRSEYFPARQFVQEPSAVAPVVLDDLAAAQAVQAVAPATTEYLPAIQFLHEK